MSHLRFGTDARGSEILELVPAVSGGASRLENDAGDRPYKGENTIVMMEWERPYMRALVDVLGITGESDVLEIGFGCGYSASRIQEFSPRSHTIVEPDPTVLAKLKEWAKARAGIRVVEGFWQTALPGLGTYDAIFFDDFPLPGTPDASDLRGPESRWHAFVDLCLAHHLPVGGRITGYLARPLPLARPGCRAEPLVPFPVDVPENCSYFPYEEAYIPLLVRVEEQEQEQEASARGARAMGRKLAVPLVEHREDTAQAIGSSSRKRQKRQVLEALVQDSLGLGKTG